MEMPSYDLLVKQYELCHKNIEKNADYVNTRFTSFFTINSALIVMIGLFLSLFGKELWVGWILIFIMTLAIFGILLNQRWIEVIKIGQQSVDHWPLMMQKIEAEFERYFNIQRFFDDISKKIRKLCEDKNEETINQNIAELKKCIEKDFSDKNNQFFYHFYKRGAEIKDETYGTSRPRMQDAVKKVPLLLENMWYALCIIAGIAGSCGIIAYYVNFDTSLWVLGITSIVIVILLIIHHRRSKNLRWELNINALGNKLKNIEPPMPLDENKWDSFAKQVIDLAKNTFQLHK